MSEETKRLIKANAIEAGEIARYALPEVKSSPGVTSAGDDRSRLAVAIFDAFEIADGRGKEAAG